MINLQDAAKIALAAFVFRTIVKKLGFSVRKVSLTMLLVWLVRSIYKLRAPSRTFPSVGFTNYPILGEIEPMLQVLKKGGSTFQIEESRKWNFISGESVVFATPRQTYLMDPRDREHILKPNWKNYVKNNEEGAGFQENFAEIMGRGIFAVVRVICSIAMLFVRWTNYAY